MRKTKRVAKRRQAKLALTPIKLWLTLNPPQLNLSPRTGECLRRVRGPCSRRWLRALAGKHSHDPGKRLVRGRCYSGRGHGRRVASAASDRRGSGQRLAIVTRG